MIGLKEKAYKPAFQKATTGRLQTDSSGYGTALHHLINGSTRAALNTVECAKTNLTIPLLCSCEVSSTHKHFFFFEPL